MKISLLPLVLLLVACSRPVPERLDAGAAGGGTAGPARLVSGDNTSSWESWASGALIVTGTAAESPPGATPLYLEVTINGTLCTLTALHA